MSTIAPYRWADKPSTTHIVISLRFQFCVAFLSIDHSRTAARRAAPLAGPPKDTAISRRVCPVESQKCGIIYRRLYAFGKAELGLSMTRLRIVSCSLFVPAYLCVLLLLLGVRMGFRTPCAKPPWGARLMSVIRDAITTTRPLATRASHPPA